MISIITPTFNRAGLLPRLIESVKAQTYLEWELLIIDDGSLDNTKEVVNKYIADERIKYYYTENSGATKKRNFGAKMAVGEYLIFLDSDDEAKPNWLSEFKQQTNRGFQVVCCGLDRYDYQNRYLSTTLYKDMQSIFEFSKINYLAGTLLMEKSIFFEVNGYDENLKSGQHFELFLRLYPFLKKNNIKIGLVKKALIKIYMHSGNRIRHNHRLVLEGTLQTLEKHSNLFKQHPEIYHNYLSVASVSAFKSEKSHEGKRLAYEAWKLKPFYTKALFRLIVSQFPFIAKKIWK